jgi:hypothetical protein
MTRSNSQFTRSTLDRLAIARQATIVKANGFNHAKCAVFGEAVFDTGLYHLGTFPGG